MDNSSLILQTRLNQQDQRDNRKQIIHSQRPPLAKRGPTQQSKRSGLNLNQFESFYMKNAQNKQQRVNECNQSNIEHKENISFVEQNNIQDEKRTSKTRIQSAKPFNDVYKNKNTSFRSNSQNRDQERMKNLIAISIRSYEKPTRDVQSAKSSNNSLVRAGSNIFQRFESQGHQRNLSKHSQRSGLIMNQQSNKNLVSTKNINISVNEPQRCESLLRGQNNSHLDSQTRIAQSSVIRRQNSEITKPSNIQLKNNNTQRQSRLQSIQTNVPLPYISAQSWSIYDANQLKFVNGKKENYKREVASITKMMTFYTCLKIMEKFNIDPENTILTVSRTASRTNGTSACLREGDQLNINQLFYGLMLPSGNDAAYQLAEYFGQYLQDIKYKEQIVSSFQFQWSIVRYFLKEMNLNAFKLKMFSSQFDSPHGLANKHNFSTAADICLLAKRCMEIEQFRQVVNKTEHTTQALASINNKKLTQYNWENTNKLLGQVEGFIGCKTGITNPAGPCFCGGYEKDGHSFIVVVLSSKSVESRWVEVPKMIDWVIKKQKIMEEFNKSKQGDKSKIQFNQFGSSNGFSAIREEIIDKNVQLSEQKIQGSLFRLGQNTPTYQLKQEVYVPRQEALDMIKRIEIEARNRIDQYKQFTLQLKEKYDLYEKESDEYYQDIITEQRAKLRYQIKEKEELLSKLKLELSYHSVDIDKLNSKLLQSEQQSQLFQDQTIKSQLMIANQQDSIYDLEQKLQKLQDEYNFLEQREPVQVEVEKLVYVEKEEDNSVDLDEMESIRKKKQDKKQMIMYWYQQFERENQKSPELEDFSKCKGLVEEFMSLNKQFTDMKLRLLRSDRFEQDMDKFKPKPVIKEYIREEIIIKEEIKKEEPVQATSIMGQTMMDFEPQKKKIQQKQNFFQEESPNQSVDQSIDTKALREEIEIKEQRNAELQSQISRLEKLIGDNVSENQLLMGLQEEIEQKQQLIDQRDLKINQLIVSENLLIEQKSEIIKDLEKIRKENSGLQYENDDLKEQLELHVAEPIQKKSDKVINIKSQISEKSEKSEKLNKKDRIKVKVNEPTIKEEPTIIEVQVQNPQILLELERFKRENSELRNQIEILKQVQMQPQIIEKLIEKSPKKQKVPELELNEIQQLSNQIAPQVIQIQEPIVQIDTKLIDELTSENLKKDVHIAKLNERIIDLQSSQATQNDQNQTQSNETAKIQAQANLFKQKILKKKSKIAVYKQEKSSLEQNITNLNQLNAQEISKVKREYEEQIQQHELEIQSLKRDQQKLMQSGQSSMQGIQEQHQREIQNLIQSNQVEIDKLQESIDAYRIQLEKLERARGQLQDQLTDLELALEEKNKKEMKMNAKLGELSKIAGEAASLKENVDQIGKELKEVQKQNVDLEGRYKEEQKKRKQLHNELEDSKGQIRLYCRVRPLTKSEQEREESKHMAIIIHDEMSLTINLKLGPRNYTFDSVFGPNSTQDQVFEESKRLVQSSIDGFNVCIFAYGQTGSGKTFTIQGTQTHPGLTPRAIDELFTQVQGMNAYDVKLRCYMVELYKEEIRDLLLPKNAVKKLLEVKESATGMVVINGVTEVELGSVEEANRIFNYGLDHRMTRATKMNEASSRSHLIFSILIDAKNTSTKVRTIGKLSFVDLAGSENQKKTGTDKEGADEARAINMSLSALGNVIEALSKGKKHIPYRDHTLTKIMKDSLGGTAKTLMFVNVSPSAYNDSESKNSMDYATRVKSIKNQVKQNIETKEASYLKSMVVQLESALDKYKEIIMKSNMAGELAKLKDLVKGLENEEDEGVEEEGDQFKQQIGGDPDDY